jgi:outer membrane lipoprotein SlyB
MKRINIIVVALAAVALTGCGKNDSFNGIPTQPS